MSKMRDLFPYLKHEVDVSGLDFRFVKFEFLPYNPPPPLNFLMLATTKLIAITWRYES